jgi:adenylate cyclase
MIKDGDLFGDAVSIAARLEGLAEPCGICVSAAVRQHVGTRVAADKPSVAMLPFTNMSGDPEQEFFAEGIAEDIITAMSRYPSVFVIARNSSSTYKAHVVDVTGPGQQSHQLQRGLAPPVMPPSITSSAAVI